MVALTSSAACTQINRATLAASTAALACDWAQTRSVAERGWGTQREVNPIMGPTPTATQVDSYFAVVALWNVALWMALPKRLKSVPPLAVMAVEYDPIHTNLSTTSDRATRNTGVCGLRL